MSLVVFAVASALRLTIPSSAVADEQVKAIENGASMSERSGEFVAELLRKSARACAAHAAERLLSRSPECAAHFGAGAYRHWHENLTHQINELAAALAVENQDLFCAQVDWSREAFDSRRVPIEYLRQSLESLREALLEDLPVDSHQPAIGYLDRGMKRLDRPSARGRRLSAEDECGRIALQYLEAVLSGDRRRAVRLVVDAVDDGLSIEDAYERVLLPAQYEVGMMWHLDEISVAEEHAATETTRTTMSVLSQRIEPAEDQLATVLIGAVEGDRHDIGARAVSDLFELAGFRAILIGGDVPIADLARAVVDFDADLLVLAAALNLHLSMVGASIRGVRQARPSGLPIIVGGPAFHDSSELATRLGADLLANSPREAVRLARQLLASG